MYYALALIAALRWPRKRFSDPPQPLQTPVSILKPVRGRDPGFYECIRSHAAEQYSEFEILFGMADPQDAAREDIERLAAEFPDRPIRVIVAAPGTPNGKAGLLAALADEARYPILLVNDSDIEVQPGYLEQVVATLERPGVGLATCLYRAAGDSVASSWEALGIATEFMPSILVARLLGQNEFALGSTLAIRAADIERIGGFRVLGNYLADDYQLGRRICQLGYRIEFAPIVVRTRLGAAGWRDVWKHQKRWARTIRVSRPAGYCGYAVTHATVWAVVAALAGAWKVALITFALRMTAGLWVGAGILGDRQVLRRWPLIPLRDLLGFLVWISALFGGSVEWRGRKFRLASDGQIVSLEPERELGHLSNSNSISST